MREESSNFNIGEKEELKREIKREVKPTVVTRRRGGCLGCFSLTILIIIAIFGYASWTLAATGLLEVPVFSKFYSEPAPWRAVAPKETSLENILGPVLSGSGGLSGGKIILELEESQLTYLIKGMENREGDPVSLSRTQFAVGTEEIELFTKLRFKERGTVLRAYLAPRAEEGGLKVDFSRLYLGNVKLPDFISKLLFKFLLEPQLDDFNSSIADFVDLQEITLAEGKIIATTEINTELIK